MRVDYIYYKVRSAPAQQQYIRRLWVQDQQEVRGEGGREG